MRRKRMILQSPVSEQLTAEGNSAYYRLLTEALLRLLREKEIITESQLQLALDEESWCE